jgi:hypothetical protein
MNSNFSVGQKQGKVSWTERRYYSFATKFCSWHNQDAYSLWDYNVDEALWKRDRFAIFKRQELCEYPRLTEVVKEFRTFYGLQQYSHKDVDKFLWRVGDPLMKAKAMGEIGEHEENQRFRGPSTKLRNSRKLSCGRSGHRRLAHAAKSPA